MGETWQLFNSALKLNRCQLNWFLHIEIAFIERKLWSLLFPIWKFAVIQLAPWVRFNYVLKVCNRVQRMEAVKWREKTLLTWLNLTWQTFRWMEKPFSNTMGGPLLKSACGLITVLDFIQAKWGSVPVAWNRIISFCTVPIVKWRR